MDSLASWMSRGQQNRNIRHSLMGWSAVLRADLISLSKSWILRIWVLLLIMSFLIMPVAMLATTRTTPVPASSVLAAYLAFFLNVWGTVIIVLSAGSVSAESDIVSDSILSRACTRTQYLLAKLSSRILVVGGLYLIGSGAAAYASWRYGINDVTLGTMLTGISIVGMALLMLVSLGVTMSVLFNNTIFSIIGLLLLWYVAGNIFTFAGADYMSPKSLTTNLPQILRDSNAPKVLSCSATGTSVTIRFSKELNPDTAEQVNNYTIESSDDITHSPQTAVYNKSDNSVILSGMRFKDKNRVTATVSGITDLAGNTVSLGADSAKSAPVKIVKSKIKNADKETDQADETATDDKSKSAADDKKGSTEKTNTASKHRRFSIPPGIAQINAAEGSVSVIFTQEMDPEDVEKISNYTVESPFGATHKPQTAAYSPSTRTVLLSGLSLRKGDPVKVTVKNVNNMQGIEINSRNNSAVYREVKNWKYLLGFGIPSLIFIIFGVIWYTRRDL